MLKNLRNKLNEKKNKKGFTLIELIIVIAIIAILAALLLPKIGAVKENSNKTSDVANGKKIAEAVLQLAAEDKMTSGTGTVSGNDAVAQFLQVSPTGKTSGVKGKNFTYTLKDTGEVEVKLNGNTVYPSPAAMFQTK
ncbi:MAG: prepilin-type N-terminal cleavage/methylation domain-containing protein [Clostridium sp.]|nr:prepilin-type N-terminal cleavage/methylation domain-containing protein [Clostridium sp.]